MYYKKVRFATKWDRYYKLGQELLQSGAGNLLQREQSLLQIGVGITKWSSFGATIAEKASTLRDTRTNGNP